MNTVHGTSIESKQADANSRLVDDERWALALRVASSRQLLKALQLREILLYICQRVLKDPATVIREQEIGHTVLGRREDFNPNDDNIVRVQISHLRKKLDEYFLTDGLEESLILTIPKGNYVPRFTPRNQVERSQTLPSVAISPSLADLRSQFQEVPFAAPVTPAPAPISIPPPRGSRWWTRSLAMVLLAVAIVAAVSLYRKQATISSQTQHGRTPDNFIWSNIFNPASPPSIVVADSCLGLLQDSLGTDIGLADYIGGHYPENLLSKVTDEPLRRTLTMLTARQYTSFGDVDIASGLVEFGDRLGATGSIHYARHMNIRNFQSGNSVLIGSRRSNPWVGLFEPQLNFYLDGNAAAHKFFFHNRNPKPGEPGDYLPVLNGSSVQQSYADIALIPNLGKTGYVLILNGITMETAEAAGQLLMRGDFPQTLGKMVGSSNNPPRSVEILISVRALGGAASNSEVIAYRLRS